MVGISSEEARMDRKIGISFLRLGMDSSKAKQVLRYQFSHPERQTNPLRSERRKPTTLRTIVRSYPRCQISKSVGLWIRFVIVRVRILMKALASIVPKKR